MAGASRTERIVIEYDVNGAATAKRVIDDVGNSARRAGGGVDFLAKALALVGGIEAARRLTGIADNFTAIENRIRSVTRDQIEFNTVFNKTFEISQRTRSSFEENVRLYQRLRVATKELGLEQRTLFDFQELLNKALKVGGATAAEQQASLQQLTQGLASNTLQGDEFRSIREQLPFILPLIAQQLDTNVASLKKFAEQGKITTDVVIKAFLNAREEIEGKFAKTFPTLSDSVTQFKNSFIVAVGELNKQGGFTGALSRGIAALAQDTETLKIGLMATIGILSGAAFVLAVRQATSLLLALSVSFATNPFGFIAVGLSSLLATLLLFNNSLKLSADSSATLRDAAVTAFKDIQVAAEAMNKTDGKGKGGGLLGRIAFEARDTFKAVFPELDTSLRGILITIANVADDGIGMFVGMWEATKVVFSHADIVLQNWGIQIKNKLVDIMQDGLNTIVAAYNKLIAAINVGLGLFGQDPIADIPSLDLSGQKQKLVEQSGQIGQEVAAAFLKGVESQRITGDFLKFVFSQADWEAAKRDIATQAGEILDFISSGFDPAGSAAGAGADDKKIDKMADQLRRLQDSINPAIAAQRELADAKKFLDEAVTAGIKTWDGDILTKEKAKAIMDALSAATRDAREPMQAFTRDTQLQISALKLGTEQRQIMADAQAKYNDLVSKGVKPTQDLAIAALFAAKATADAKAEAAKGDEAERLRIEERKRTLEQIIGPQQQYQESIRVATELLREGAISLDQFNTFLKEQQVESLRTSRAWDDGLSRSLKGLTLDFTNSAAQMENFTVGTFRGLEDTLLEFFDTGKAGWRDFAQTAIREMERIFIQRALLAPLAKGGNSFFDWLLGAGKLAAGAASGGVGFGLTAAQEVSTGIPALAFAKGGVSLNGFGFGDTTFAGNIRMLAKGDILTRPTAAIMAEAGSPEAVMPLTRMSNGNLGVEARGSAGGGAVEINSTFNVTVQAVPGMSQEEADKQGRAIAEAAYQHFDGMITNRLVDETRDNGMFGPGGGLFNGRG